MIGLFASIYVFWCPRCGAAIPSAAIIHADEPELRALDCESCKAELQARFDRTAGKMVVEKR